MVLNNSFLMIAASCYFLIRGQSINFGWSESFL